jgi:hypothetical protein
MSAPPLSPDSRKQIDEDNRLDGCRLAPDKLGLVKQNAHASKELQR